jgi:hypothetical protein
MDDLDCFLPPDWCEELVYLGEATMRACTAETSACAG